MSYLIERYVLEIFNQQGFRPHNAQGLWDYAWKYEIVAPLLSVRKHKRAEAAKLEVMLNWLDERASLGADEDAAMAAIHVDDRLSEQLRENLSEVTRSFSGKIVINGSQQVERLMQLLILLEDLRAGVSYFFWVLR